MKFFSKHLIFSLPIVLIILAARAFQFSTISPTMAQGGAERPFQLPFAEPPGPDTWLLAQPYGNTTGAYRQRFTTYGRSGGIHFGIDLSAPCGTEIVAIADGVVFAVDGPYGSLPHNLMIDHPNLGYASLYGHLLKAPDLVPGQQVQQGEVIARSGSSRDECPRGQHLHLEIRDLKHVRKYNPTLLIEANWDSLALISSAGRDFARNLDEPHQWQTLYDQPEAWTGGPILNNFANVWPLDWHKQDPDATAPAGSGPTPAEFSHSTPEAPLSILPFGRQITTGNCCTNPHWSPDATQVRFIDQPTPDSVLGIWGVDVMQLEPGPKLITERLGTYSPDGKLIAYPDRIKGLAVVERLADGQIWTVDSQGRSLGFTPNSQQITWTSFDEDVPRDRRVSTMWLADIDGSNRQVIYSERRINRLAWLSDTELLLSRSFPDSAEMQIFMLSLEDGGQTDLFLGSNMRGLSLSPDKRYLVYYVTFEEDSAQNGTWLYDLQAPGQAPRKLPFFGTYRWRDSQRLIYVPFEPASIAHNFHEYDVSSGQARALFPDGTGLTIANNDWAVSSDGQKIVLVAAKGINLDGLWVLDLSPKREETVSESPPCPLFCSKRNRFVY